MNWLASLLFLAILPFGVESFLVVRSDAGLTSPSPQATEISRVERPETPLALGCTPNGNLVPIVLSYSVVRGGSGFSSPILSYVVNRTPTSIALTTNSTTYYMDPKTVWRTTNPLPGSSSTERWATSQAVSGTATLCMTVVFQYTHQYLTDLEFIVKGGGLNSGQEPTITYTAYGSRVNTRTVGSAWIDAGTQCSYTNPLSGSSQSLQWFTPTPSGNVSSASRVSPVYYYQLRVGVSYAQVGAGGTTPPTFSSTSLGGPLSFAVNTTATQVWLDAGTPYSFTNPLTGSASTERWATSSPGGTVLQSGALSTRFYHQYLVLPFYALKEGGSPRPPTLSYGSFGAPNLFILPAAASQSIWMDAGSRYSAQNPLDGSTAAERWMASSSDGNVSSTQQQLSFTYYNQFAQGFDYSVTGGGSPLQPVLKGIQFGKSMNASLATRTGTFWLDNSSSWSVSNPLGQSSTTERWMTSMPVGGTVSRAGSVGLSYTHQYYLGLDVSPMGSGSVEPQSGWQNAGATLALVATPGQGWGFQSWQGTGYGSYSGSRISTNLLLRSAVFETANFFSGILVNATDGGTVYYQYGQITGTVKEGTTSNILVPFGTTIFLRAAPTNPFTKFSSWSGDLKSTSAQVSASVNSPMIVSAGFVYDYVNLVLAGAAGVVAVGAGGTVMTRRRRSQRKRNGL